MKNFSVKKPILFLILLLTPFSCFAGKIQCWVNAEGTTECGNYITPQYSQRGFTEYNKQGRKIKEVEPAPTPEELAELQRQKEQEDQLQRQEKQDSALLTIFSTETDIEQGRAAVLSTIDGQIQSQQTILDGLEGNFDDIKRNYDLSKKNPDVSEKELSAIRQNLADVEKRIKEHRKIIQDKQDERIETQLEYDTYLQRYLDIRLRQLQKKPSLVSQSQLATLRGQIDEVNNRREETVQQYLTTLQERINNASLSQAQFEALQAKIDGIKKTYSTE